MDYSYLGKPVVNASLNNCHVRYNFSVSPKSHEDYENLLMNVDWIRAPEDKDLILEYCYIHNLFMLKSWTIRDYDAYLKSIEGSSNAHSWPFFQDFKHGNNSYELRDIIVALHYFLTEEAPFLSRTHFTQVKSSELTETKEVLDVFDVWDI